MRTWMVTLAAVSLIAGACGPGQQTQPAVSPSPARPQQVRVTALEYAFEHVPDTVPAGETTFVMRNDGQEPHVMFFVRIDDTDMSLAELMRLPERRSERFIEELGGIERPVGPGKSAEATLELELGRYAYVCFVSAPDGNAHYEKGMLGELEVTS